MQRSQDEGYETLRFRLDRYDERTGERLQALGVEMSGPAIGGNVGENETVEVAGQWDGGSILATDITNVTTGSTVRPLKMQQAMRRRYGKGKARWALIVFGVVGVVVAAVFATIIISVARGSGKSIEVPDVVGQQVGKAQFALANAGVTLPHIKIQGNEFCNVVRQDPTGGTQVSADDTVTLIATPTGRNDPGGCR